MEVTMTTENKQEIINRENEQQKPLAIKKEKSLTVNDLFRNDRFQKRVASILPKYTTPERFFRIAYLCLTKTPKLANCTVESIEDCLLKLSQFGLEPDGRRAHLIPFFNNKTQQYECSVIVDYKGIVELISRSGIVRAITCEVVCEKDEFEVNKGKVVKHVINYKELDRGNPYAAYAIIEMKDGFEHHEIMSWKEIMSIKARSKSGKLDNSPWVTDTFEMAKKTVFRRAAKWIPWNNVEVRDVIEVDDSDFIIEVEGTEQAQQQEGEQI